MFVLVSYISIMLNKFSFITLTCITPTCQVAKNVFSLLFFSEKIQNSSRRKESFKYKTQKKKKNLTCTKTT